jgi:hypothetical protein
MNWVRMRFKTGWGRVREGVGKGIGRSQGWGRVGVGLRSGTIETPSLKNTQ